MVVEEPPPMAMGTGEPVMLEAMPPPAPPPASVSKGPSAVKMQPQCTLFDVVAVGDLSKVDPTSVIPGGVPPKTQQEFEMAAVGAITKYALRQPANAILAGLLYLGSQERARDREYLVSLGITNVLSLATNPAAETPTDTAIQFHVLSLPDAIGFSIMGRMRRALEFVENEVFDCQMPDIQLSDIGNSNALRRAGNKRILFVHCLQGISRSTTFVILFLLYRLFLSLPGHAVEAPDVLEITQKVQLVRQVCPNTSFQAQLCLLADALTATLSHTEEFSGYSLKDKRRTQFDYAMCYCEAYLVAGSRNVGEMMYFVGNEALRRMQNPVMEANKLGLSAWAVKSSPLKQPQRWLWPAVAVENLTIYGTQLISTYAIASMKAMQELEAAQFEEGWLDIEAQGDKNGRAQRIGGIMVTVGGVHRGSSSSMTFNPLAPVGLQSSQTSSIEAIQGPVDTIDVSQKKLCPERFKPRWERKLPPTLYWSESNKDRRIRQLQLSMGLTEKDNTSRNLDRWWDERVVAEWLLRQCDVTEDMLEGLIRRFQCKTWSLWLAARSVMIIQRLRGCLKKWTARIVAPKEIEVPLTEIAMTEEATTAPAALRERSPSVSSQSGASRRGPGEDGTRRRRSRKRKLEAVRQRGRRDEASSASSMAASSSEDAGRRSRSISGAEDVERRRARTGSSEGRRLSTSRRRPRDRDLMRKGGKGAEDDSQQRRHRHRQKKVQRSAPSSPIVGGREAGHRHVQYKDIKVAWLRNEVQRLSQQVQRLQQRLSGGPHEPQTTIVPATTANVGDEASMAE